ncbi:MAG TPA: hypothetical protein VG839_02735 [Asticcacaulis sp.]|nr:hypothetical protein [Asticcacaulis sp.]
MSLPEGTQLASQSAAAALGPGSPDAHLAHARHLIQQVNKDHDLQTSFINLPKFDPHRYDFLRNLFKAIGHFFKVVGDMFAPVAPILPYILYAIAIAAVLILLSPVARLFLTTRFERLFARDHLRADAPWRPTKAAVTALLSEIDALAAEGRYDEAVHLLLIRSVADINAYRPDLVRMHYSARDILSHPLLPEAARPAFRQIVEWVEKSYFAGIAAGKAGFDACRRAYVDFVAAEGIA